MTSLKTIISNFFLTLYAHGMPICPVLQLFLASQGVSQVTRLRAIEPADIPIWLKHLDQSRTKTAEELDVLLGEDRELFIEVSVSFACVFVPHNTADRTAK